MHMTRKKYHNHRKYHKKYHKEKKISQAQRWTEPAISPGEQRRQKLAYAAQRTLEDRARTFGRGTVRRGTVRRETVHRGTVRRGTVHRKKL